MSRFENYEFVTDLIGLSALAVLMSYALSNIQNQDLQWTLVALQASVAFFYCASTVKARHK